MSGTITQTFKNQFIAQFINSVRNSSNNFYIAFGKNFPWPDDNNPPVANTSISSFIYQVYRDMLFGKRISASDIAFMTKRVLWKSGTVYDIYDDQDPNMYSKNFFVINAAGRVYKCLDNNNRSKSTVVPNQLVYNGDFKTADGYRWKFLYNITSAENSKFVTSDYINVKDNVKVQAAVEPGAIHTILVQTNGGNYISANGTIEQVISPTRFKIANSSGSTITGAHNLSTFYIVDASGNYQDVHDTIASYSVTSAGKFVTTSNPLNIKQSGTLYYKICPQVEVVGDGADLFAVANVNNVTRGIHSIDVINRGLNYTYATVNIIANSNFGTGATARAIISPPGGHGSNNVDELGCDVIGMSLITSAADNLPPWITYRQVSFLHNPLASANGTPFQNTTFTQMIRMGVFNVFDIFPEGEIVVGQTSGATGEVIYQTTTELYLGFTTGNFTPFETLTGTYTGYTCSIDTINNRDLIPNTGDVYYYRNLQPISRVGATSDRVKIYFKI